RQENETDTEFDNGIGLYLFLSHPQPEQAYERTENDNEKGIRAVVDDIRVDIEKQYPVMKVLFCKQGQRSPALLKNSIENKIEEDKYKSRQQLKLERAVLYLKRFEQEIQYRQRSNGIHEIIGIIRILNHDQYQRYADERKQINKAFSK